MEGITYNKQKKESTNQIDFSKNPEIKGKIKGLNILFNNAGCYHHNMTNDRFPINNSNEKGKIYKTIIISFNKSEVYYKIEDNTDGTKQVIFYGKDEKKEVSFFSMTVNVKNYSKGSLRAFINHEKIYLPTTHQGAGKYSQTIPSDTNLIILRKEIESLFYSIAYHDESLHDLLRDNETTTIRDTSKAILKNFILGDNMYLGGGGQYYDLFLKTDGPYKTCASNEVDITKKLRKYFTANIVSLCAGGNDTIENTLKKFRIIDADGERLFTFLGLVGGPVSIFLLYKLIDGISQAFDIFSTQQMQDIVHGSTMFGLASIPIGFFGGLLYDLRNHIGTYQAIDIDPAVTTLTNKIQGYQKVITRQADIFEILKAKEGGIQLERNPKTPRTISIVGCTYGNFRGGELGKKFAELIDQETISGDRVYITYFPQAHTPEEQKQHIGLYDNPYQRELTQHTLQDYGFPHEIKLTYTYNADTHTIENHAVYKDITGKLITQLIHSSARISTDDILDDLGKDTFEIIAQHTQGTNAGVVLERI